MTSPVRKVVTRTHKGFRAKFPSRKMGAMVGCESLLELQAARLFEFHPYITAFHAQPVEEYFYDDRGYRHSYTPDFKVTFSTLDFVYVEVKPEKKLRCPTLSLKYKQIADSFARRKLSFRLLTERELYQEPRLAIVDRLRSACKTRPAIKSGTAVQKLLGQQRRKSFGALAAEIGELEALKLIASGALVVNFSRPLNEDSLVFDRHANEVDHDPFRI
jgi:TnsA endonuclease N terminal